MTLAIYIKDPPKLADKKTKKKDRYFYLLISLVGFSSIIFAVWPFLVWQFSTLPKLESKVEGIPVPENQVLSVSTAFSGDVNVVKDPDGFSYFTTTYKPEGSRPEKFFVSIPKLGIKNATAKIDDLNFRKNLSHFPGTALPGEVGNSFITGHSVLPQFNDPENYNAIFTKLSDLEIGDKVNIEMEGKNFQYVGQYLKVVDPRDTSVLLPISENGKNLTLMTCVPPGSSTKRLVVITSLI